MSTWTTGAIIAANMFIAAAVAAGGFAVWQAIRQPPRAPVPYDVPSLNDPDPQVGWTLKASFSSTDCRNPLVKYHTNDRGFRAAEPGEVAPRKVDVIVVGGSQSFGAGVPYGGTFAAVLEDELGLRVANLSVGSYGGVASVLLTDRFADLRPSLLIYGFWEDHLFRNLAKCQNSYAPYCVSQPHLSCADGETCRLVPPGDNTQSMRLMMDYVRDQGQGRATYGFLSDLYWTVRLTAQTLLRQAGLADQYVRVSDPATLKDATSAFFELIANRANLLGASPVVVFIPLYFNNIWVVYRSVRRVNV